MDDSVLHREIARFDPDLPIEKARTPPAAWYVDPAFLAHEADTVFRNSWQCVGRSSQVSEPGTYLTSTLLDQHYIVTRDETSALGAFHNVCRHHAARNDHNEDESSLCHGHSRLRRASVSLARWWCTAGTRPKLRCGRPRPAALPPRTAFQAPSGLATAPSSHTRPGHTNCTRSACAPGTGEVRARIAPRTTSRRRREDARGGRALLPRSA